MLREPRREGKHFFGRDLHAGAVNVELRHLRYATPPRRLAERDPPPRVRRLTVTSAIHSAHRDLQLIALHPIATFPLDLLWRSTGGEPLPPTLDAFIALAAGVTRDEAWAATER